MGVDLNSLNFHQIQENHYVDPRRNKSIELEKANLKNRRLCSHRGKCNHKLHDDI